jgi:putative heme iron utilization protein
MADETPAQIAPALQARRLLRAARVGTLATTRNGQPAASLVTPAIAVNGDILLLLSDIAEHTRHLRADPRCALMVTGEAETANPQTAPRVSVSGLAELSDDAGLKARHGAIHPYAALYAGFGDFHLWRIRPAGAMLVGGFARAFRIRAADIVPAPAAADAIASAEAGIIFHCNQDHAPAMAAIARAAGGTDGAWRMVAADPDGCDLALDESSVRIHFSAPVADPAELRAELVRLARASRSHD